MLKSHFSDRGPFFAMAVYTELSVDEVAAFFRVLGLGLPRSVRGITTGIENTNYFVNTEAGEYVLTLFERLTFEELPFYLHLMKHLAARRMPVPDPVANVRGEILHTLKGRPAVIVNRLPGESVTACERCARGVAGHASRHALRVTLDTLTRGPRRLDR